MAERAAPFRAVHVDFGTGDGTYVRRLAPVRRDVLHLGVDAIADNLRAASRRAQPNLLFGRLALADAPGALVGLADRLTVLFPWGSLLEAVATPRADDLARLAAILRPGAEVRFLFELAGDPAALERAYAAAGLPLRGRAVLLAEARTLPTTWAKKLGFSGRPRAFWEFATPAPTPSR